MSHAANLRSSQRAQQASSKKRKLSQDNSHPTINGINGILHDHAPPKIQAAPSKDIKALKQRQSDTTAAKIAHADSDFKVTQPSQDAIELSGDSNVQSDGSDEEEDEEEGDDVDEDDNGRRNEQRLPHRLRERSSVQNAEGISKANGIHAKLDRAESARRNVNDDGEEHPIDHSDAQLTSRENPNDEEEPSFGDLLRSRHGAMVDITADDEERGHLLPLSQNGSASQNPRRGLSAPNANSLGTVLSQALRTNDAAMLESCLQVSNLQNIRTTIERLPSQQAGELLQRLAERMHRRPGRAGSLMVWIQWTVVAHGGYLATQPAVMGQLKELYRVVKMRANALQPLLALKGKLDMLEAQLQLRRNRADHASSLGAGRNEGVIYIEGETSDDDSDDEGAVGDQGKAQNTSSASKPGLHRDLTFETDDEADDEPMVNGVSQGEGDDLDQEDDGQSEDDDEDLIDDEAESVDSDESVVDEDVEFGGMDDPEDSASDAEEEHPSKKKARR
ncbi:MAG: hypothetical protein Q9162_005595 [Coniocarpon cinnabarinum]